MPFTLPPTKVGSEQWVRKEHALVTDLISNDLEDFAFAARGELEWLNEHLTELMEVKKGNRRDMATLLQTPGKLRGMESPLKSRIKSINAMQENIDSAIPSNLHVKFTAEPPVAVSPSRESPLATKFPNRSSPTNILSSKDNQREKSPATDIRTFQTPLPISDFSEDNDANGSFLAISRSIRKSTASKRADNTDITPPAATESTPVPNRMTYEDEFEEDEHTDTVYSHEDLSRTPYSSLKATPSHLSSIYKESPAPTSPFGFAGLPARAPLPKKSSARSALGSTNVSANHSDAVSDERPQSILPQEQPEPTEDYDISSPFQELIPHQPPSPSPIKVSKLTEQRTKPDQKPAGDNTEEPTSEATQGSFIDVLRRAKKLLFDGPDNSAPPTPAGTKSPQKLNQPLHTMRTQAQRSPQKLLHKSPQKVIQKTPAAGSIVARLMAPTYASASASRRDNTNAMIPAIREAVNLGSPRADRKALAPGLDNASSPLKSGSGFGPKPDSQQIVTNETIPKIVFGKSRSPGKQTNGTKLQEGSVIMSAANTNLSNSTQATAPSTLLRPLKDSPIKVAEKSEPSRANTKLTGQTLQPKKAKPVPLSSATSAARAAVSSSTSVGVQKAPKLAQTKLVGVATPVPRTRAAVLSATKSKSTLNSDILPVKTGPAKSLVSTSLSVKSNNKVQMAKLELEEKIRASTTATVKSTHTTTNAAGRLSVAKSVGNISRIKSTQDLKSTATQNTKRTSHAVSTKTEMKLSSSSSTIASSSNRAVRHLPSNESASTLRMSKRPSETEIETPLQHKHKSMKFDKIRASKTGPPSLIKAAMIGNAKINNQTVPSVEGVKFSNDTIKFGKVSGTTSGTIKHQTPVRSGTAPTSLKLKLNISSLRAQQQQQQQQQYGQVPQKAVMSGDDIILPEIMSESEDDDEGSVLADWANSPELRELLAKQQKVNPDLIFGPMPTLQMDEVFEKSTRLSKLRPRSSSANWSGHDRLTQQEVEEYAQEMGYLK